MPQAATVANHFLQLARERGEALTPMQLLKLVYIAHGWTLGLYHRPLIDNRIEAWQYGPVIPDLYRAIRTYGSQPVDRVPPSAGDDLTPLDEDLIEQVYRIYGHYSGPALSRITHARGTPWSQTYEPGSFGLRISNDLIEDHYATLAMASAEQQPPSL